MRRPASISKIRELAKQVQSRENEPRLVETCTPAQGRRRTKSTLPLVSKRENSFRESESDTKSEFRFVVEGEPDESIEDEPLLYNVNERDNEPIRRPPELSKIRELKEKLSKAANMNQSTSSKSSDYVNDMGGSKIEISQLTEEKDVKGSQQVQSTDISPRLESIEKTAKSKDVILKGSEEDQFDVEEDIDRMHQFLFSSVCENRAHERRVLWGKVRGWGVWPLQRLYERRLPGVKKRLSRNQIFVIFFGTREVYWVNRDDPELHNWKPGVLKVWQARRRRNSKRFLHALHDVAIFLAKHNEDPDWTRTPVTRFTADYIDPLGGEIDTTNRNGKSTKPAFLLGKGEDAKSNRKKRKLETLQESAIATSADTDSLGSADLAEIPLEDNLFKASSDFRLDVTEAVEASWVNREANKANVMWAKIRGHPFWPVQVVPKSHWDIIAPQGPRTAGRRCLMFFGTLEAAWLRKDNKELISFQEGVRRKLHLAVKNRSVFQEALYQVLTLLEPSISETPYGWWNSPDEERQSRETHWIWPPNLEKPAEKVFELPNEIQKTQTPKFQMVRRNIYPPGKRMKRLPRDEIPTCDCRPPAKGEPACGEDCINRMSRFTCDPSLCNFGNACSNRAFQNLPRPKLKRVFFGGAKGWGIVSEEDIGKDRFIIEYVGEVIDAEECEKRLWEAKFRGEHNYYMMELSADTVIDARYKGAISRFINSSCDPNCEALRWQDAGDSETRIGIFAKRDIKKGQEITYDYAFEDFSVQQSFKCECNSETCRKWLDAKPERLQRRGEKVHVERRGRIVSATIVSYEPSAESYKVMFEDEYMEYVDDKDLEKARQRHEARKRKQEKKKKPIRGRKR